MLAYQTAAIAPKRRRRDRGQRERRAGVCGREIQINRVNVLNRLIYHTEIFKSLWRPGRKYKEGCGEKERRMYK